MFHEFIDVSCHITTFLKSSVSPEDEYYLLKSENAHSLAKVALFLFTAWTIDAFLHSAKIHIVEAFLKSVAHNEADFFLGGGCLRGCLLLILRSC